jgi:hypothetical protein
MDYEPKDEATTFSGKNLAEELLNQQVETGKVEAVLQRFGEEERHSLVSVGGVEVIGLGTKESVEPLTFAAQSAIDRIETHFDGRLSEAFPGLKIYFADGVIDGGGEALAGENAVIIDAAKGKMSTAEAENFLAGIGELDSGDWSKHVGPEVTYAEITIVHELGHILEAKMHEQEGIAFASLSREDAPTKYGQTASNEDYAESFFYYIYGAEIDPERKIILQNDIEKVTQAT